jgi:hypothetical protein
LWKKTFTTIVGEDGRGVAVGVGVALGDAVAGGGATGVVPASRPATYQIPEVTRAAAKKAALVASTVRRVEVCMAFAS